MLHQTILNGVKPLKYLKINMNSDSFLLHSQFRHGKVIAQLRFQALQQQIRLPLFVGRFGGRAQLSRATARTARTARTGCRGDAVLVLLRSL